MTTQRPDPGGDAAPGPDPHLRLLRGAAFVTGVFTLAAALVMGLNWWRLQEARPTDSQALSALRRRFHQGEADARLREEIRALDLVARQAVFRSQRLQHYGAFLLLGGAVLTLAALKAAADLSRGTHRPAPCPRHDDPVQSQRRRRAVIGLGAALLVLAAAAVAALVTAPRLSPQDLAAVARPPGAGAPGDPLVAAPAGRRAEPPPAAGSAASYPSDRERVRHWPAFRGPFAAGVAHCTHVPQAWDGPSGRNIRWRVPVPRPGFSSPVVWDGRIYLTGADREVPAEVYCFDAGTGTLLWRHAATDIAASPQELPDVTEDTGYAAPTPATDGERVCALFATGDLVCLAPDGERLWARNLGVPDNHYGHASSLLLDRGTLLVQYDHFGGSRLLGIDPQTGETRFQTARPDVQISWASPLLARAEGRRTLVLAAAPLVAGYDPATGAELWRAEVLSGEVGPSPAYAAGRVFVANQYAQAAAIRLGGRGDVSETHVLWTGMDHLPDVASPVATAEHLFLATSAGILACLDAATGEVRWTHETEKGFWASPILAGDRLYALDRGGRMHIALAAGTFTPIATPSLAAETVCTPAFLEGRIYVRTTEELICIGDGDE